MTRTDDTGLLLNQDSDVAEIAGVLRRAMDGDLCTLTKQAYLAKSRELGREVFFRGIVEFSNRCRRNCRYCGIRRGNRDVERYCLSLDEIVDCARFAAQAGYGSIVLQSGERIDRQYVGFVEDVLRKIRESISAPLGITLSMGEQSGGTYRRWFEAGADRYLLRIETSNPALFAAIHTSESRFEDRLECLRTLRDIGYQVGTGVMIGLPGQTVEDLARDIDFFRRIDADMIGMGPYVPHDGTPMGRMADPLDDMRRQRLLDAGLAMIAATRLVLLDINIAATTVMQALSPVGRELALLAGANVLMPNITPVRYRASYQIYNDKPCIDENADQCRSCLERRVTMIGETTADGNPGNPLHFTRRSGRTRD